MRRLSLSAALVLGLVGVEAAQAHAAATYTVPPGAADATGHCSGTAPHFTCTTLRAALAHASSGSTITLRAGTYPIKLSSLDLPDGVTIQGAGARKTVIKQVGQLENLMSLNTGLAAQINSVELTSVPVRGFNDLVGGLIISYGTLTLRGDLLAGTAYTSVAVGGGAIWADSGTLKIVNTTVTNNRAAGTPGLPGAGSSGIGGNGGNVTGPIYINAAKVTITGSTISDNHATGGAGGSGSQPNGSGGIGGSGRGGAIYVEGFSGASLTAVNDTITGNRVTSGAGGGGVGTGDDGISQAAGGGGIFEVGSQVTLANTTVSGNTAISPNAAGGDIEQEGGTLTLEDTILAAGSVLGAGSSNNNCLLAGGTLDDLGYNLEDDASAECLGGVASDVLTANARLGPLRANGGPTETLGLLSGSPALGAGGACTNPINGGFPLVLDQRGKPRPEAGPCDIGAFQAQRVTARKPPTISGHPVVGTKVTCLGATFGGDGPFSYRYAWLRDGSLVPGAGAATYRIPSTDAHHHLACRVTATGPRGSASETSPAVTVSPS